jgi:hypothetical protein
MAKTKSKAVTMAADSAGEMVQVQDRRFEAGDWPIRFEVTKDQADTWLQYLWAECRKRGWSCSGSGQIEAKENSGSISITSGTVEPLQLAIVWERKLGASLKVRARSAGAPEFPLGLAKQLFQEVNERCRAGVQEQIYLRGQLSYDGLPWRGELWLSDMLRLGPPSRHDESVLVGPQVILIDAQVEAIDRMNAPFTFEVMLRELSVFLSILMRKEVRVPHDGRIWTWKAEPAGQIECEIRNVGYRERDHSSELPAKGQVPGVPMVQIQQPDFSLRGIFVGDTQQSLASDVIDLWRAFAGLAPDLRQHCLQVGSIYQSALSLGHTYETSRFAWMVAACEALKPREPQFRDHNIYHVVEALLGKPSADLLQEQWFRPQDVRNAHLHSGEFRGSEFVQVAMMSSFQDPTFDQASRVLAQITPAAIIEWLRRGGSFTMPPLKRRMTRRRWSKEHAVSVLPVFAAVGLALGVFLRWRLRRF